MPNHVMNSMKVSGNSEKVDEFIEKSKGVGPWTGNKEKLSFAQFIRPPNKVTTSYDKYGYNWCNENWGTKWGAYDVEIEVSENSDNYKVARYFFRTAWSPPSLDVFRSFSSEFPNLKFEDVYNDPITELQGKIIAESGEAEVMEVNDENK